MARRTLFILSWCLLFGAVHAADLTLADSGGPQSAAAPVIAESELTAQALNLIGIRYRYGGNSPQTGFDCSGFVRYVFMNAGAVDLPHSAADISRLGQKVHLEDLEPGDLVFYNTRRRSFSHVGIYIGENKFVHAPASGGKVRIENMELNYWKKRFNGARRIQDIPPRTPAIDSIDHIILTAS